jgi:hypothetical protein
MADEEVPLTGPAVFDKDLYGATDKYEGFNASIADEEEEEQRPTATRHVRITAFSWSHRN